MADVAALIREARTSHFGSNAAGAVAMVRVLADALTEQQQEIERLRALLKGVNPWLVLATPKEPA